MDSGGRMVRHQTNRGPVVQSHLPPFLNLGNFIHLTFAWDFQNIPFCLVSMPGEVKYPTQGVNV